MYSVTKRVLTRKSILGFGYKEIRDLSVQMILDLNNHKAIASSYFGLSKIDFTPDILDEIMIPDSMRINKPGKVDNLSKAIQDWFDYRYSILTNEDRLKEWSVKNKIKSKFKTKKHNDFEKKFTNEKLRAKNHGNYRK